MGIGEEVGGTLDRKAVGGLSVGVGIGDRVMRALEGNGVEGIGVVVMI